MCVPACVLKTKTKQKKNSNIVVEHDHFVLLQWWFVIMFNSLNIIKLFNLYCIHSDGTVLSNITHTSLLLLCIQPVVHTLKITFLLMLVKAFQCKNKTRLCVASTRPTVVSICRRKNVYMKEEKQIITNARCCSLLM